MHRKIAAMVLTALSLLAVACQKPAAPKPPPAEHQLSGAGATFPAPIYSQWARGYLGGTGVQVNYQALGSGAGIRQITSGTIDFGGSDKPLTAEQLDAAGLTQFPTVIGGVVPVVNAPGIGPGQLRLDGPLLADIFAGKVTMWTDPRIVALNPGLTLPRLPITVVHRSEGSGSSFLFTAYLAKVSPAWKAGPGVGDSIAWPTGLGGKGNDGVSAFVRQTLGSIGYVEYAYATRNHFAYVLLKNHNGRFVAPTGAAFAAAAAGADWTKAPGFYLLLLDQPGEGSWPITGATFILIRKDAPLATRQAVEHFFNWAYDVGDGEATKLGYVPLPASVKALVVSSWVTSWGAKP